MRWQKVLAIHNHKNISKLLQRSCLNYELTKKCSENSCRSRLVTYSDSVATILSANPYSVSTLSRLTAGDMCGCSTWSRWSREFDRLSSGLEVWLATDDEQVLSSKWIRFSRIRFSVAQSLWLVTLSPATCCWQHKHMFISNTWIYESSFEITRHVYLCVLY